MDYAQRISSLVLSLRKKEKLRVRQPLQKILLPILNDSFQAQVDKVKELILSEVNVKEIEYLTEDSGFIQKKIKPNFKTLGKTLGKNMKSASQIIASFDQKTIQDIEKTGHYHLTIGADSYELTLEDFELSTDDIPGWQVATDRDITVALDISLTESLENEGTARELVNRIQNLRKQLDFDVTDRIIVRLERHPSVEKAVHDFKAYIASEVLADQVLLAENLEGDKTDLLEDVMISIQIEKV